jgi:hypothetical protein
MSYVTLTTGAFNPQLTKTFYVCAYIFCNIVSPCMKKNNHLIAENIVYIICIWQ